MKRTIVTENQKIHQTDDWKEARDGIAKNIKNSKTPEEFKTNWQSATFGFIGSIRRESRINFLNLCEETWENRDERDDE